MRILVLGAYGFIGAAIARELQRVGHQVTGLGRNQTLGQRLVPGIQWVEADISALLGAQEWHSLLADTDGPLVKTLPGIVLAGVPVVLL